MRMLGFRKQYVFAYTWVTHYKNIVALSHAQILCINSCIDSITIFYYYTVEEQYFVIHTTKPKRKSFIVVSLHFMSGFILMNRTVYQVVYQTVRNITISPKGSTKVVSGYSVKYCKTKHLLYLNPSGLWLTQQLYYDIDAVLSSNIPTNS